jgi:hypothetical protein
MDINKCGNLIQIKSTKKCILNDEKKQCIEINRICEEMDANKCGDFTSTQITEKYILSNNKCEEVYKSCDEMYVNKCQDFIQNNLGMKCSFGKEDKNIRKLKQKNGIKLY